MPAKEEKSGAFSQIIGEVPDPIPAGGTIGILVTKLPRGKIDWLSDMALASFLPTIVFLSIPVELFLGNPNEFPRDVLPPFFLAAGASMGILFLLSFLLSPTLRAYLSRLFFFMGLFVLLSQILVPVRMSSPSGMEDKWTPLEPVTATLLQLMIFLLLLFAFIRLPQKLLRPTGGTFAVLVLILLLVRMGIWGNPSDHGHADHSKPIRYPKPQATIPGGNIYRLLFDSFCSQEFKACFPQSAHQKALKDFIFYPENRANYLWTQPSVTCCKTGSFFKGGNMREWIIDGTIPTISGQLLENGWITSLYGNPSFKKNEPAFRKVSFAGADKIQHDAQNQILHRLNFADLCLLRLAPVPLRKNVYDQERGLLSRKFGKQGVFSNTHLRVGSALNTFRTMLAEEKLRGHQGHYIEAHFYLPHNPYVLDGKLVYHPQGTTIRDQIQACFNLIDQFVSELKRLDRYDNATIIIHSDHGFAYKEDHPFCPQPSASAEMMGKIDALIKRPDFDSRKLDKWSQALLLIKPPHRSASQLAISQRETQTADIAATIFSLAGIPAAAENGSPILGDFFPLDREIHIFEGYKQPDGYAIHLPRCEMNHFSFTKSRGWKIYPAIQVIND